MKGIYKRGKSWCDSCDKEIVEHGKKCKNCGVRSHANKLKNKKKEAYDKEQY